MAFVIDKGNTLPALTATLRDGNGTAINLAGTTVNLYVRNPATGAFKVNGSSVSVTDAPNGRVQYTWTTLDTNTAAVYLYYFVVTYPGGATVNVPNESQNVLEVIDPAQTISASLAYCNTDDLRRFGTDTTEADDPEMSEVCLTASRVVDDYCGVEEGFFGAATARTVTFYDVRNPIVPVPVPFATVTAVEVDDRPLDATSYTVTGYGIFLGINSPFDADGFPRRTLTQLQRMGNPYGSKVEVTASFGYSSIPKPVKRAAIRLAARLATESDAEMFDPTLTNITVEGYSRSYNFGISQQRIGESTGDGTADRLLRPYRRQFVG